MPVVLPMIKFIAEEICTVSSDSTLNSAQLRAQDVELRLAGRAAEGMGSDDDPQREAHHFLMDVAGFSVPPGRKHLPGVVGHNLCVGCNAFTMKCRL